MADASSITLPLSISQNAVKDLVNSQGQKTFSTVFLTKQCFSLIMTARLSQRQNDLRATSVCFSMTYDFVLFGEQHLRDVAWLSRPLITWQLLWKSAWVTYCFLCFYLLNFSYFPLQVSVFSPFQSCIWLYLLLNMFWHDYPLRYNICYPKFIYYMHCHSLKGRFWH